MQDTIEELCYFLSPWLVPSVSYPTFYLPGILSLHIQQIIKTRCFSSTHWLSLCWWLQSSLTCTRSVYLESMLIIELRRNWSLVLLVIGFIILSFQYNCNIPVQIMKLKRAFLFLFNEMNTYTSLLLCEGKIHSLHFLCKLKLVVLFLPYCYYLKPEISSISLKLQRPVI